VSIIYHIMAVREVTDRRNAIGGAHKIETRFLRRKT